MEYETYYEFKEHYDKITDTKGTSDSTIKNVGMVSNIIENNRIYHDPNSSQAQKIEAMKNMVFS